MTSRTEPSQSEGSTSDYSTDEGSKRKRVELQEADIFKKSKKISRTPKKENTVKKTGEDMEEVKDMIKSLMLEIKDFRKENQEELKLLKEQNKILKQRNETMNNEITLLKKRVEQLEEIEQRVEFLEKDKRKNNIVISGMKINNVKNNEELKGAMENFLKNHLTPMADIQSAQKIKDDMCVVELKSFETKLEIMKNKGKVDSLKREKIFINSDLTKTESRIQKKIRDRAKIEKDKRNTVKIGYLNLTINGQKWKWDKKDDTLKPHPTTTKN